jgi:hypothetical protein
MDNGNTVAVETKVLGKSRNGNCADKMAERAGG